MYDGVYLIEDGVTYKWIGPGLGAQLISREWHTPPAGMHRSIRGVRFKVFQTRRLWLSCEASWGISHFGTLDELHARIRAAREELFR